MMQIYRVVSVAPAFETKPSQTDIVRVMKQTKQLFASLILIFSLFAMQAPAWAEEPAEPKAAVVNINTATAAELARLNGIGETKALAIVADRDTNGPFHSEGDLTRVRGIGDVTVEKNADHITTR
jgi:competence protein ComEA